MGGAMLLVFLFFFKSGAAARSGSRSASSTRIAFIPLTYWIDRTAYRSYLSASARGEARRR